MLNGLKEYFIQITNKITGEHENCAVYGDNFKDALKRFDVLLGDKFGDTLENYKVSRLIQKRCEYRNHDLLDFYKNMGCMDYISVFYFIESYELDNTVYFLDKYGKQYEILKNDIISITDVKTSIDANLI